MLGGSFQASGAWRLFLERLAGFLGVGWSPGLRPLLQLTVMLVVSAWCEGCPPPHAPTWDPRQAVAVISRAWPLGGGRAWMTLLQALPSLPGLFSPGGVREVYLHPKPNPTLPCNSAG